MRLALLSPSIAGPERFTGELASGLAARGHRVRVITSQRGLPSRRRQDGVEVLALWRPPDSRLRRRYFDEHLTHVPLSYLALRLGTQDVAHATAAADAIAASRWASRGEGVSVFSYPRVPSRRFLVARRLRLATMVRACRDCDAVVMPSRAAADAARDVLGVEARVIHPGVNLSAFAPGGDRAEMPTVFCPDASESAVETLHHAWPLVRRSRPDARLVVSPPGEEASTLVENYRRAWVTVVPGAGEAFNPVLGESLACGTPAVAPADAGNLEVIDREGVGSLVDGDVQVLGQALLDALELSQRPGSAEACRNRAMELSSEHAAAAYEALYRELLGCETMHGGDGR